MTPTQVIGFLGYEVSSLPVPTFTVPAPKISKLSTLLASLPSSVGDSVAIRDLATVAGRLLSMSLAIAPARLFTRGLYRQIGEVTGGKALAEDALNDLNFWRNNLRSVTVGCSIAVSTSPARKTSELIL